MATYCIEDAKTAYAAAARNDAMAHEELAAAQKLLLDAQRACWRTTRALLLAEAELDGARRSHEASPALKKAIAVMREEEAAARKLAEGNSTEGAAA